MTASDHQTLRIDTGDSTPVGWVDNGDGSKALMVSAVPAATTPGIDTAHPANSRVQDGTGTALAVVKAPTAIAESDNALAVQTVLAGGARSLDLSYCPGGTAWPGLSHQRPNDNGADQVRA